MTPTAEKLIEMIAEAGSPLTLDQIMDMLPYADRQAVSRLCRELVQAGRLRSTAEDGRLAYDVANGVARIKPAMRSSGGKPTNLERIRQLLTDAAPRPLPSSEVIASLPDMREATVRKTLSNGVYKKAWISERRDGVHVYALPEQGTGSATAVAVATATAAPAPAPAPTRAPAAAASGPAPMPRPSPTPPTTPARPSRPAASAPPLGQLLDEAVSAAEQAVEEYVASVGSLAVYRALKHAAASARDARAALGR